MTKAKQKIGIQTIDQTGSTTDVLRAEKQASATDQRLRIKNAKTGERLVETAIGKKEASIGKPVEHRVLAHEKSGTPAFSYEFVNQPSESYNISGEMKSEFKTPHLKKEGNEKAQLGAEVSGYHREAVTNLNTNITSEGYLTAAKKAGNIKPGSEPNVLAAQMSEQKYQINRESYDSLEDIKTHFKGNQGVFFQDPSGKFHSAIQSKSELGPAHIRNVLTEEGIPRQKQMTRASTDILGYAGANTLTYARHILGYQDVIHPAEFKSMQGNFTESFRNFLTNNPASEKFIQSVKTPEIYPVDVLGKNETLKEKHVMDVPFQKMAKTALMGVNAGLFTNLQDTTIFSQSFAKQLKLFTADKYNPTTTQFMRDVQDANAGKHPMWERGDIHVREIAGAHTGDKYNIGTFKSSIAVVPDKFLPKDKYGKTLADVFVNPHGQIGRGLNINLHNAKQESGVSITELPVVPHKEWAGAQAGIKTGNVKNPLTDKPISGAEMGEMSSAVMKWKEMQAGINTQTKDSERTKLLKEAGATGLAKFSQTMDKTIGNIENVYRAHAVAANANLGEVVISEKRAQQLAQNAGVDYNEWLQNPLVTTRREPASSVHNVSVHKVKIGSKTGDYVGVHPAEMEAFGMDADGDYVMLHLPTSAEGRLNLSKIWDQTDDPTKSPVIDKMLGGHRYSYSADPSYKMNVYSMSKDVQGRQMMEEAFTKSGVDFSTLKNKAEWTSGDIEAATGHAGHKAIYDAIGSDYAHKLSAGKLSWENLEKGVKNVNTGEVIKNPVEYAARQTEHEINLVKSGAKINPEKPTTKSDTTFGYGPTFEKMAGGQTFGKLHDPADITYEHLVKSRASMPTKTETTLARKVEQKESADVFATSLSERELKFASVLHNFAPVLSHVDIANLRGKIEKFRSKDKLKSFFGSGNNTGDN